MRPDRFQFSHLKLAAQGLRGETQLRLLAGSHSFRGLGKENKLNPTTKRGWFRSMHNMTDNKGLEDFSRT